MRQLPIILGLALSCSFSASSGLPESADPHSDWLDWERPADNPVFTTGMGNNHDSILFVEAGAAYPYHLIISHTPKAAHLWRAKSFSWKSDDWELVSDNYTIGHHYEYDDGVKVGDTYYIYEAGKVYTFSGDLAESDGKWEHSGSFPAKDCDDIGVYYEDGLFHIFGEHGDFPHGPDGTSLAHFTSPTGLGDWTLVDPKAVDPNPDGSNRYGVGDATIIKVDGSYLLFCDLESKGVPYRVTAWQSDDLEQPFQYLGVALEPRSNAADDWDNHRVQDPEIAYIPEMQRFVITCNMMDVDGNPGGNFPTMKPNHSRVIGTFYSGWQWPRPDQTQPLPACCGR